MINIEGKIRKVDNSAKAAFAVIKDEILQLKRAKNKQFIEIENLKEILGEFITKKEFYDRFNYLNEMADKSISRDEVEFMLNNLKLQLSQINANIDVLDEAIKDLYPLKKHEGELQRLKSKKLSNEEFYESMAEVRKDFDLIKKKLSSIRAKASKKKAPVKKSSKEKFSVNKKSKNKK